MHTNKVTCPEIHETKNHHLLRRESVMGNAMALHMRPNTRKGLAYISERHLVGPVRSA